PSIEFPYLGTRGIVGIIMLIHIFFATLFVGYAVGSPLLQMWSVRTGNPRFERLAHSIARFNVLTFSVGATWAVMFLVVLLGFYPRVTTALFTHFFWFFPVFAMIAMVLTLWLFYIHYYRAQNRALPRNIAAGLAAAFFILSWQWILTGIDSFMVTGGGEGGQIIQSGTAVSSIGSALDSILNPVFLPQNIHRTFGNLSWPAFAVAAWAAFSYTRAKSDEDKAFYDWAGSMGVTWGTAFLLLQPLGGFLIAYSMKSSGSGSYERLTGEGYGSGTFTSHLLLINLAMVVALFVLSNAAMYLGAGRHPDRAGRRPIQSFGLLAALTGLYSISPLAEFPSLYMRYIMLLIMVLATLGALIAYVRGRHQFRYGSPGGWYRGVLLSLGILAAVVTLSMGWMKSNSRAPYTIYGQPGYQVESEQPVTPEDLQQKTLEPQ
ncbi:MAG: cytochrome ubiquinol oxidase subunit I, partial [Actinobacteria bacterium]|nr:cytochrome ubiquinol oxidase subunit I [Actinomycetota bacterium]